ncbi:arsenate reductase (thioredoxin) [Paenibacillus taihuensis]|nr:arsenate reductase (thioredoxin) [Paenibacillus taihuensis]
MVVLFLCTGNSCRSQMAEGFAKYYNTLYNQNFEIYSAGIEAHGLNPRAVQVMEEAGVSIASQTSDTISLSLIAKADLIITLCGHADDNCPTLPPRVQKIHWGFDDPAKAKGSEEEIMLQFRVVRDLIDVKMKWFIQQLSKMGKGDLEKLLA